MKSFEEHLNNLQEVFGQGTFGDPIDKLVAKLVYEMLLYELTKPCNVLRKILLEAEDKLNTDVGISSVRLNLSNLKALRADSYINLVHREIGKHCDLSNNIVERIFGMDIILDDTLSDDDIIMEEV